MQNTDHIEDNDRTLEGPTPKTNSANSTNSSEASNEHRQKESKWKKGDELNLIRVRFPGNAKTFPFLTGKRNFSYGQKVVAVSDRGTDVGYINSFPYKAQFNKSMLPLRSITKIATNEDIEERQSFLNREKEGKILCKKTIEDLKLDMNITHVEVMQFGKKMVFYFTAPSRIDFRELVKILVAQLKMRIELRQISVRDRAAGLGSIGACGLMTCCSSFLTQYGGVSIKMAKNQNLALIPSKLNGVCGQIKCCIKYEDNVYSDKRKRLPKESSFIETKNGDRGKITRLHVLVEQFEMITDKGIIKRYSINQFDKNRALPDDWRFPEKFDYVKSENKVVIGLEEESQIKSDDFLDHHEEHVRALKNDSPIYDENEKEKTPLKEDHSTVEKTTAAKEGLKKKEEARQNRRRNNKNKPQNNKAKSTGQNRSKNNRGHKNKSKGHRKDSK